MKLQPGKKPDADSVQSSGGVITRTERIILLLCFIIALLYAGWQVYRSNLSRVELGEDIPRGMGGIVVQVEGAVVSPGMIFLPAGSKVSDAVEAADGFTSDADVSNLDLGRILSDGERLVIASRSGSTQSSGSGNSGSGIRYTGPPIYDAPFPSRTNDSTLQTRININTANTYELQTLPGIGEELASRIIEYRQAHNGFNAIEDIMLVDGIGETRFEEIRDLITVRD
jgi:competence protein ComEA